MLLFLVWKWDNGQMLVEVGQWTNVALGLPSSSIEGQPPPVPVAAISDPTSADPSHWKLGEKDHGSTVKVKEVLIKLWNVRIEKALKWEPLDYTMGVEVGGSLEDRPTAQPVGGPPLTPPAVPTALLSGMHTKRHRDWATMKKYSQLKRQRLVTQSFCAWMNCSQCFERKVEEMDKLPPSSASKLGCRACRLRASADTESLVCLNLLGTAYLWKGKRGKRCYREWFDRERRCKNQEDRSISMAAGIDCLHRVQASTFWEWKRGSRLFFWRWGRELWNEVRDSAPVWVKHELPITKVLKHRHIKDKEIRSVVAEKLGEVRAKGYVTSGDIESLILVFPVPKGDDICLVYNGFS